MRIQKMIKLIIMKVRSSKLIRGSAAAIEQEVCVSGLHDQTRSLPVFERHAGSGTHECYGEGYSHEG